MKVPEHEPLAQADAVLDLPRSSRRHQASDCDSILGTYRRSRSHEPQVRHHAINLKRYRVRLALGLPLRDVVTVTTNVPGPGQPLYGMGRRLLEIIPYVPIAAAVRTGVAIFSYCGDLTFGITGDFEASPDLDVLARGIEHGVAELLASAKRHHRRAAAARRRSAADHP